MTEDTPYIHGTDPIEQQRLSTLNSLLNDSSLRAMNLQGRERVLDVGSGLGQFSRALAQSARDVSVVGVEPNPRQLEEAERQASEAGQSGLVEFRAGSGDALPLADNEWGTFDVVHARFVLEHVPRPLDLLTAMARALRPGGRMILEDDDHELLRCWPEIPEFQVVWEAYSASYEHLECEPSIGRQLVTLMHAAGLQPVRNDILFFGSCAGPPSHEAIVNNMIGVVETARNLMVSAGLATADQITAGLNAFCQWGRRPDSALWYGRCWAEASATD